jgi:hypothetical protein
MTDRRSCALTGRPRRALVLLSLLSAIASGCGGEQLGLEQTHATRSKIRPTDGDGWNGNGYGAGVTVKHWDTPSGKFRIHYALDGKDAVLPADSDQNRVPDFVEQFGLVFDQVIEAYVDVTGFRLPLSDEQYHDHADYGGDGRFDVYLKNQGGGSDGYLVTEACASGVPSRCAGYMVVENDFVEYSYPSIEQAMWILASHEFFTPFKTPTCRASTKPFPEGTAVWGTEHAFPETSDFEHKIPLYFESVHRPINDTPKNPADLYPYGTAIWPKFLAERFGKTFMTSLFEQLGSGQTPDAIEAIDAVLKRDHQSSVADAFSEFALWNLLTGSRTTSKAGYQSAADYPEVALTKEARAHPYRIVGEINYLSVQYHRLAFQPGLEVTVDVETDQAKLAVHLVTGKNDAPTIVSGKPVKSS